MNHAIKSKTTKMMVVFIFIVRTSRNIDDYIEIAFFRLQKLECRLQDVFFDKK